MQKSEINHRKLAVEFFNKTWDFLDKSLLNDAEKEEMIHTCHASFYHWTKAENHTPTNLSIGYWQLARVYAVAGLGESSLLYASKGIDVSVKNSLQPFYIAYVYEAAVRAYLLLGDHKEGRSALERAFFYLHSENEEDVSFLKKDLEELERGLAANNV